MTEKILNIYPLYTEVTSIWKNQYNWKEYTTLKSIIKEKSDFNFSYKYYLSWRSLYQTIRSYIVNKTLIEIDYWKISEEEWEKIIKSLDTLIPIKEMINYIKSDSKCYLRNEYIVDEERNLLYNYMNIEVKYIDNKYIIFRDWIESDTAYSTINDFIDMYSMFIGDSLNWEYDYKQNYKYVDVFDDDQIVRDYVLENL